MKYIAKNNCWFDESTEAKLLDDYRNDFPSIDCGLFLGLRKGELDEEICTFDEFYEIE